MSGWRLTNGEATRGRRAVGFTMDGRRHRGLEGDTLASALLADGVTLMGRSFKYHRPRGVFGAGVEEPNALFGVGEDGRFEPNTRATDVRLYDGLVAVSQNRWPGLHFDVGAVNRWLAPFIPAGFYYKTFFGGPRLWRVYEHFIRRAAGLGAAPVAPEADAYEHRAAFCDVLVVGAGPAGLAAAAAAARGGARVILVEQDAELGGSLLRDPAPIDGMEPRVWAERVRREVVAASGRVLIRTTAAGVFDHGMATLVQRLREPGQAPSADGLSQRLWRVRAGRLVLATGAIERPLLFSGNDMPGVMLSTAVRTYVTRHGVACGRRAAVATCTDDAYRTVRALQAAGVAIVAVLDARAAVSGDVAREIAATAPVHFGALAVAARGGKAGVRRLLARVRGETRWFDCDLVAVSGGFSAVTHLHMQAGGSLAFDEDSGAFIPDEARGVQASVGAAAGCDGLTESLAHGWAGGAAAAMATGRETPAGAAPETGVTRISTAGTAYAPAPDVHLKTAFVDLQNDVTAADVDLAWREGYRSVEQLKRYTTLGMATDQGKTSNLVGLARLAGAEGRTMPEVGVTTFRPPYTPVTLGALAGEATGGHAAPERRMALHAAHQARGAVWQPSGYWSRPRAFPRAAETVAQAGLREARTVRATLGVTDVSTLAKFEVVGPDAAGLLERVCATTVDKLKVGRGRYTFMLREDGFVDDDGTVWRLGERRYLLTSSTGGADRMATRLSYVREVLAPALEVAVVDLQEHWAGAAVAGPNAREALEALLGMAAPAHMGLVHGQIAGVAVRVLAASYSGERAFEVYAAAHEMPPVWTALTHAVETREGAVYGLEALELLRIEKGHPEVGAEIDGRRTPADLGLQKMLNPRGGYFGAAGLARPALHAPSRERLIGLQADGPIPEGAMLLVQAGAVPIGHVSSAGLSLGGVGAVALALAQGAHAEPGAWLLAVSPTRHASVPVRVTSPHHYDPAGERYRD